VWIYLKREGAGKAPNESECRSCRQPVTWVVNVATGKSNILDGHDLAFSRTDRVADLNGDIVTAAEVKLSGRLGDHVSHFSTCKDSDKWRR